jgi:hypothetical protein
MTAAIFLYTGAGVISLWGISHIIPTKSVVAGFGTMSADNARILTMEWVAEGLTLIFVGLLVIVTTLIIGPDKAPGNLIFILVAVMLIVMAVWSALTGARTAILPMKACPFVKSITAILFILAVVL